MNNIPLNIDYQQILLHLLNFIILFAILYFLLYKPVRDFMNKRKEYYEKTDADSIVKMQSAEAKEKEYNEKFKNAEAEIEAFKAQERQKQLEANDKSIREAKEEAAHIIAEAKAKAEEEHARVLEACKKEIPAMVAEAAEKVVLKSTTFDAYEQFLSAVERGADDEQKQ